MDDDRQRYSAWYRDYGALSLIQDDSPQAQALQQQPVTRSQQLMAASNQRAANPLAPIVDLQIALITPLPIISKPMQVRLTRRNQCSDLRGYTSQGSYGGQMSPIPSSMSTYASSATAPSSSALSVIVSKTYYPYSFLMLLIVTLLVPLISRNQLN